MNTANDSDRSDIEDLLPWHATGTLGHRDTQRVEAALAGDPKLAVCYELAREDHAQTIHLNETLGAPSPRTIKVLFAKIAAEPARSLTVSIKLRAHIREFFASLSPRTLAWSASAAALAILLQAGLIAGVMLKDSTAGGYETASAPTSVAGEGAYALIRFRPQANASEITRFLETNKLTIAGGPSAGGLYRVRVAAAKLSKTDLARIVRTLQDEGVIGFIAMTD